MIHEEHPFAAPPEERDPVRRLRGRLVAPVTVVTAGRPDHRTGLTISSLVVAEGDPAHLMFLVGSSTDLFEAIRDTGRFVVHVLEAGQRSMAAGFAGARPAPGGLFAGLEVGDGDWGPVLSAVESRVYCTRWAESETAYHVMVDGRIDGVDVGDLTDPLAYFRGGYRRLESG